MHLFSKGQTVKLKARNGSEPIIHYVIVDTLPPKGSSPQYKIRNENENFERIITQELIELTSALIGESSAHPPDPDFKDMIKIPKRPGSQKR